MRSEIRYKIDTYIMLARTTTIEKLKNEWCLKAADLLNDFIEIDNCETIDSVFQFSKNHLIKSEQSFFPASELYLYYVQFCKVKSIPCVNNVHFGKALHHLGFNSVVKKVDKKAVRTYLVEYHNESEVTGDV